MSQTTCSNCGWPYAVSGGKCGNCGADNCFVTTAVCGDSGLPDDCRELTVLRAFRDRHMTTSPARAAMLTEYYQKAPDLVAKINFSAYRSEIYAVLREQFINPAVQAAESGDDLLAERLYVDGMNWVIGRI